MLALCGQIPKHFRFGNWINSSKNIFVVEKLHMRHSRQNNNV